VTSLHLKEFWDSPTTQKLVGVLALPLGYLALVPLAYKIEQNMKDENGNAQIVGFAGNFTFLYTSVMVAPVAIEAAKTIVPLMSLIAPKA
jgi:hypothetical protein